MSETGRRAVTREFSAASFGWRLATSLVLVLATYNPTPFCYFNWLRRGFSNDTLGPEHFVIGIVILSGWAIFVVATRRSLGVGGLVLAAALIGGIVWLVSDFGLNVAGSFTAVSWVILICLSVLLAVGLSWSHIWRRMTGQLEVDDNDT